MSDSSNRQRNWTVCKGLHPSRGLTRFVIRRARREKPCDSAVWGPRSEAIQWFRCPRGLVSGLHYSQANTDKPNALESPKSFHADFCDSVTGFRISSGSKAERSALAHAAWQRSGDAGWGDPPLLRGRKINFSRLYPRLKTRRPGGKSSGPFFLSGRAGLS